MLNFIKRKCCQLCKLLKKANTLKNILGEEQIPSLTFEDLAPTISNDYEKYVQILRASLVNENVNNIALSGAYGSGKSSIIKTFLSKYPKCNALNISLASFTDADIFNTVEEELDIEVKDESSKNKSRNTNLNRLLELSILQQMFYHVKSSEIPDSRFKRIKNLSRFSLITKSIAIVLWLLSALIIIKKSSLSHLLDWLGINGSHVFLNYIPLYSINNIYSWITNNHSLGSKNCK